MNQKFAYPEIPYQYEVVVIQKQRLIFLSVIDGRMEATAASSSVRIKFKT